MVGLAVFSLLIWQILARWYMECTNYYKTQALWNYQTSLKPLCICYEIKGIFKFLFLKKLWWFFLLPKIVVNWKQNGGKQTGSDLKTGGAICVEGFLVAQICHAARPL